MSMLQVILEGKESVKHIKLGKTESYYVNVIIFKGKKTKEVIRKTGKNRVKNGSRKFWKEQGLKIVKTGIDGQKWLRKQWS